MARRNFEENAEQGGQPERRIGRILKSTILGRRPVTANVRPERHMPIPAAEQAVIANEKVRDYLLNLEHLDGGSKAVWFHSLGYTCDEWQVLADDLMAIARNCPDFGTETTQFGIKY